MKTIYKIPHPELDGFVEVYGEPENCWFEWRFRSEAGVSNDTGAEVWSGGIQGRQYGDPEIALRDALMVATGLLDPYCKDAAKALGKITAGK